MDLTNKEISEAIQNILDESVKAGDELGCQLVIYQHGEKVIDLCSGYTSMDKNQKVDPDTLFTIFSTGKSLIATACHSLVSKGYLNYSMKLADIWPEFGCNGKETLTLEHVLRHQSGVFKYPEWSSYAEMADWQYNCDQLAAAKPAWTPGDKTVYQSLNFTWLLGEPMQRATGKALKDIINDEVLIPAGANSTFFGITEEDFKRCSSPVRGCDMPDVDLAKRTSIAEPISLGVIQKEVREACLPGFNCISNARSLAKYYAALIGNLPNTPPLLSTKTLAEPLTKKAPKEESDTPFGLGYFLWGPDENPGTIFGHHGHGGCEGVAFPKHGLAIGYTKNLLHLKQDTLKRIYKTIGIFSDKMTHL